MTKSTANPGSKVGRARRSPGQLWQVPVFLLGLFAFIGVAISAPWRISPQEREFNELMQSLRAGLEHGGAGDQLVGYAENANLRLPRFPARAAEVHFLVGSAYYVQAKQQPAAKAKDIWPRVAEHLDKAAKLGVADRDLAALNYRLGYALYQQKQALPRAVDLMSNNVEKGAEQPLQGYQLLVEAYLTRQPPDIDAARAAVRRILDLTPERDVEALALARVQHAELLMRKQMRADAIKELERVGPKASRGVRVKARLLQAECCEKDGLFEKALPIWHELLADASLVDGGKARILFALGRCNQETDRFPEAVRHWSEALKLPGAEGQAAGLQLGHLRLKQNESAQALADWKTALEKVNAPNDYRNPYVKIEELRTWFDDAIRRFQEEMDPQKTQAVAELYRKIAPGGDAELKIAQAAEALAKLLADNLKANDKKVAPEDVQAQYRRAGEAYESAAKARSEADRTDALWRCVQCYLAAKEPVRAQLVLHQFVQQETNEARLAEAWQALGDLYRQEGNKDAAHRAYVKCLEYPNTPFAYRSRYYLALEEEIDNKNFEKARDILKDNITGGDVERAWQEKSAFKMASLLMKMKDYGEAQIQLKECLRDFGGHSNAILAREQLGECYRKLSDAERVKEDQQRARLKPGLSDDQRLALEESVRQQRKVRIELLTEAVKTYQGLADELEKKFAKDKKLTNLEQILLRRAWFGIGECYLDNEEFEDARKVFERLQRRHRQTLEGFYSSLRICNMVELVRQPVNLAIETRESAKESVRLLLEDLRALPPESDLFRLPGVSSREEWLRWAEDTQRKLQAAPRTDNGLPAIR